jgi:hypothetical protein
VLIGPSPAWQAHGQAFGRPKPAGTASARTVWGHHAWPWSERAQWRAHRRLNIGEGVKQTEGKWSLNLGLPAATRKCRRGGQEGGAHREGALLQRFTPMGRRHRREGDGVVEVAEEVVGEVLLGDAELATG